MVLAQEPLPPPRTTRTRSAHAAPAADPTSRADALRRIVAEVSSLQDLGRLFEEVIDATFDLFGVDRAGLWTYEEGATPLHLAAQRGLSSEMLAVVDGLPREAKTVGMAALRERRVRVMTGDLRGTVPDLRRMYRSDGMRTMCYVPILFRDEVLGLLVLYHRTEFAWSTDETDLARAFGDHIAVAMQNVRLMERVRLQQVELQHQLASQRRLLEVNERLLSTLEPAERPRPHRRLAQGHRPVRLADRLPRRPGGRRPSRGHRPRPVRRPDPRPREPARRRDHRLGRRAREAVLANDAHLDPRSVQVPGTPFEPESMIVVPLLVGGEAIGTLNIGRMGEDGVALQRERVRADQAVRRPGVDRPPERRDARRRSGSGPSTTP